MRHRSFARFVAEVFEGLLVTLAVLLTWPVSKRWLVNWGSLPEERGRGRPGDEFVRPDHTTYTRAVTVAATPSTVWPWLVQFGLGRAGFYSYELLERLIGIPVKNVESIVPEYQGLAVGDEILLHPKAPGIPVAAVKHEGYICFGAVDDPQKPVEKPDPARSWSMYVEPETEHSSRLLLQACVEPLRDPSLMKHLGGLLEAPVDFIMEQRMLRTIKRLAEAGSARAKRPAVASCDKAYSHE